MANSRSNAAAGTRAGEAATPSAFRRRMLCADGAALEKVLTAGESGTRDAEARHRVARRSSADGQVVSPRQADHIQRGAFDEPRISLRLVSQAVSYRVLSDT